MEKLLNKVKTAIRGRNLNALKDVVSQIEPEKVAKVLSESSYKSPIRIAIETGNLEIVKYLVEECKVKFGKTVISSVDPVINYAIEKGQLEIVKYLANCGAKIIPNGGTYGGALELACQSVNFDIVKYLIEEQGQKITGLHYYSGRKFVIYDEQFLDRLIAEGMLDVHQKDDEGNSLLHKLSWLFDALRFLVDRGVKYETNNHGVKPIHDAAFSKNEKAVFYYFKKKLATRDELVSALEILGGQSIHTCSVICISSSVHGNLKYWKHSLNERYRDNAEPINKISKNSIVGKYFKIEEFATISDLDNLQKDKGALAIQNLLVLERIFGFESPDFQHRLYTFYMSLSATSITLWDKIFKLCADYTSWNGAKITKLVFMTYVVLRDYIHKQEKENAPLDSSILENILNKTMLLLKELKKFEFKDSEQYKINIKLYLFHMVDIFLSVMPIEQKLSETCVQMFNSLIEQFVNLKHWKLANMSELHFLFSFKKMRKYSVKKEFFYALFERFCELSSSLDAMDENNDTPLHIALKKKMNDRVIRALLQNDARTDFRNKDGISIRALIENTKWAEEFPKVISLQSLCAEIIHKNEGLLALNVGSSVITNYINIH